ncbi:MAG TPA: hypothetical protein VGM91_05830 [Conexibacter sp.]
MEHIIPVWMVRYQQSPDGEPGRLERWSVQRGRRDERSAYPTRGGSQKVRSVCSDCNNGWMSDLETQVQPLLEPLLRKNAIRLSEAEQTVVATWAVKTALVLGSTMGRYGVVREHYADFYNDRRPSAGTLVALAGGVDSRFSMVDFKPMRVTDVFGPMPFPQTAYAALISVGYLVVWVASWRDVPLPLPRLRPWEEPLVPIWPIMNPVVECPVKYVLDPSGIQALSNVAFRGEDVNPPKPSRSIIEAP